MDNARSIAYREALNTSINPCATEVGYMIPYNQQKPSITPDNGHINNNVRLFLNGCSYSITASGPVEKMSQIHKEIEQATKQLRAKVARGKTRQQR